MPTNQLIDKTYTGIRTERGAAQVWVLDGTGGHELLEPAHSQNVRNHSFGFEWGFHGSGPAQLALALLQDATGDDSLAAALYQQFKVEVVARWSMAERWTLTRQQILTWLKTAHPRPAMTAAEHNAYPHGRFQ